MYRNYPLLSGCIIQFSGIHANKSGNTCTISLESSTTSDPFRRGVIQKAAAYGNSMGTTGVTSGVTARIFRLLVRHCGHNFRSKTDQVEQSIQTARHCHPAESAVAPSFPQCSCRNTSAIRTHFWSDSISLSSLGDSPTKLSISSCTNTPIARAYSWGDGLSRCRPRSSLRSKAPRVICSCRNISGEFSLGLDRGSRACSVPAGTLIQIW